MDLAALGLTLRLATVTTLILLLLATPLAAWLSGYTPSGYTPSGYTPSGVTPAGRTLRRLIHAAVALPLVLPPTVLGFYLLVWLGPLKPPGRLLIHLLGHPLAFTFSGLVVGSVLYSLPFAVQPLVLAFTHVDPLLTEVASTLGASPFTVFRRVVLPLSRAGFLTAAVLTFAHTIGEFGVVLMLGGDIPGLTRTLSISIYDQVQELNYTAANRTALLLVALAFAALLLTYWKGHTRESSLV